ncbi:MAG: hypothetical protein JJ992_30220 [Planctomycetes bacterium]|nr:hypothetical protein [Planctomycetota bacterium]
MSPWILLGACLLAGALLLFFWYRALPADEHAAVRPTTQAPPPGSPPQATVVAGSAAAGPVPFQRDERPMPAGDDPEQLLPRQVGIFVRDDLDEVDPGRVRDLPIYANYQHGRRTIFVELGICDDAAAARQGVITSQRETEAEFPDSAARNRVSIGGDPSFFQAEVRQGAFVSWTRGRYYFSAHARGGRADLDAFMANFPY